MHDYLAFLILAVFIASGVSFFDGLVARVFVRGTAIAVALAGGIAISVRFLLAIVSSATFSLESDGLRMFGNGLLGLYFALCILTCLPIAPVRRLRAIGLGLHFVLMPIATFLTTFSALALPPEFRLGAFTHTLSLGLIYAMLWFRMVDKFPPIRERSAPAN